MNETITSREITIAIIPKITGGLSMVASGFIVYSIVSDKEKRNKTFRRLLALLSACDVVSSFGYFLSTWPIPQGVNKGWNSPYHYAANGNKQTCTAQGWAIQFGITTVFFNIMLALHYLLVIRYQYTEACLKKKEPFMILLPLALGLGLSVPGLVLQIYNNSNLWCWISPNWDLCDEEGLTREECVDRTYRYRWAFYYGPLWICVAFIVILQTMVWSSVRQTERRVSKWRPTHSKQDLWKYSRKVATQAAYYVGVFVVTWLPYTAIAMTGKYFNPHDTTGFAVLLIVVICQPSQGLLNLLVYYRHSVANKVVTNRTTIRANRASKSLVSGRSSFSGRNDTVSSRRDSRENEVNTSHDTPGKEPPGISSVGCDQESCVVEDANGPPGDLDPEKAHGVSANENEKGSGVSDLHEIYD